MPVAYACRCCGRVVTLYAADDVPIGRRCAACVNFPGWTSDAELLAMIDPEWRPRPPERPARRRLAPAPGP